MAGSISKEALLKILGENKDALAKLEEVNVKAEELKTENPTLTVEIDAAKARAEAKILKAELNKELGSVNVTVKPDVSQFRELLDKSLSWLTGGQASSGGGGVGGVLSTIVSTGPAGLAALAVAAGAALVEVDGLVTGLTAATAGVGAFALLALPTFDKIKNAYTAISTAQQAYNAAVAKENLAPSKTNETAVKNAQIALELAQKTAGPGISDAVSGVQQLTAAFEKMAAAFQPAAITVFDQALGIANELLPYVAKFANAAAPAIEKLMTALSKQINSRGFQDFMNQLLKVTPGAITAIGTGIGQLAGAVGRLLTIMSAKDVVNSINIAFKVIAVAIDTVTMSIKTSMFVWDEASSHIAAFARAAGRDLANWAQVVDNIFTNVNNWFAVTLPTGIATAIHWFESLPGRILAAIGNLGALLFNAGKSIIDGLINGVKSAIPGLTSILSWVSAHIPSWKGPEDKDRVLLYPAGQAIMGGLIGGIGSQVPALQSTLSGVTRTISTGVGGAGGRGGMEVVLSLDPSFASALNELSPGLLRAIRGTVRLKGGGSVQAAFGKAGM